jgi:hypothetical protein
MFSTRTLHRTYWRVFNVLVRLVSIIFVLGAVTALLSASLSSEKAVAWSLILSLALGGFGALMLRAPSFRPDIDGYNAALKNRTTGPRRWWTGDPIQRAPVPPNNSLERTREG